MSRPMLPPGTGKEAFEMGPILGTGKLHATEGFEHVVRQGSLLSMRL